jgi:hypothetical protein
VNVISPFLLVPELKNAAIELINRRAYTEASDLISGMVIEVCNDPEYIGKQIYLPEFDQLVEHIGKVLTANKANQTPSHTGKCPIIIATELYFDGGHSRIAEELIKTLGGGIVILTNYFGGSARADNALPQAIRDLNTLVLPKDTAANNIIRLHSICSRLASEVYHLAHHHDVVANAALSSLMTAPVFFIHHSDHKVTLGATIGKFVHVDIVRHMHDRCSSFLKREIEYWPQGVLDRGVKKFTYPLGEISSASSAVWNKFNWEGELAYPDLIATILNSGVSHHYHIGSLPVDKVELIRQKLSLHSISADRFSCTGVVHSLWQCLVDLPIQLFVGSAPIHGLRTAIEVQGAGIPIIPFRQDDASLLKEGSFYNRDAPMWSTLEELAISIKATIADHARLARSARECYENEFSPSLWADAINKAKDKYRRTHEG